jgi:hypothetical protein
MPKTSQEKLLSESAVFRRLGNRAVRRAQEENRKLGIPKAYSHRGKLFFELPSGQITDRDPFEEQRE